MKKLLYITIILAVLLSGCSTIKNADQADEMTPGVPTITAAEPNETAAPQPTKELKKIENANMEFDSVSIDSDIITIDLPTAFEESQPRTGQIYSSRGYAAEDGNYYTFHVLRFYQSEDIGTSITQLYGFDESMETYRYSTGITYKNIMYNMPFGDAIGYVSKVTLLDDTEKYTATLHANGTYYKFVLFSTGELSGELMAIRILTSIQIDGANALKQSEPFALNMDNQTYYSSRLDGASIFVPESWHPAESMYFSLENSVLSLMSETMEGTATVRCYPKDDYPQIKTYIDFCDFIQQDLVSRGLLAKDKVDLVETFNKGEEIEFYMYPIDVVLIHFNYEYDDAFYCVELFYTGTDVDTTAELINIGESFIRE